MSEREFSKLVVASIWLVLNCASSSGQSTSSNSPVSTGEIRFGDHDIGTVTTQKLIATNSGEDIVDISVVISTLTITNPDKQFATAKFDVAGTT